MAENLTEKAFDDFCSDPLIVEGVSTVGATENDMKRIIALMRVAFIGGAQFAIARCKAAQH